MMKTKFPATVMVFAVVSSEGHIMPPHTKDFEEEVVWRAFTEFDMLGEVVRAEWDSSSLLGEII